VSRVRFFSAFLRRGKDAIGPDDMLPRHPFPFVPPEDHPGGEELHDRPVAPGGDVQCRFLLRSTGWTSGLRPM